MTEQDPAKPKQAPSLEMVLSQQANEAIQAGADPHAATEMLGTMVKHLRSSPTLSKQGADALAQGADPHAVARTVWELASSTSRPASPEKPGVLRRAATMVGDFASHAAEHPLDTAGEMITSPIKAFLRTFNTPVVGEEVSSARYNRGKAGALPGSLQIGDRITRENTPGAITPEEHRAAGAQTVAAAAFPGIASGVGGRFASLGANRLLSSTLGLTAGGATAGALSNLDDPLAGAAAGGATAAVLGATVPPVLNLAKRGVSSATTALALRPSGLTAQEMAADVAAARAPAGPQASATPVQSTIQHATPSSGGGQLGPTFGQRARAATGRVVEKAGVESSKTRALREVARRFELDNVTEPDALAYADRAGNKPVAVLDLGAGNVGGLARTAKDVPSLARRQIPEFLHNRSGGDDGATLGRITDDFEKRIGLAPENYYATIEDMTQQMKSRASSDYGKIRNTVVDDGQVLGLFDEPEFVQVHDAIRRNARLRNGEKIPPLRDQSDAVQAADRAGVPDALNPQTLGTLDKMKRHLDQIIGGKIEGGPIQRDAAYAMRERLNAALDALDEIHPEYKSARANYRGSAEAIEAYETGKAEFLKLDPRAISAKLEKMPERLRDLYRRGGYDALRTERLTKLDDGANIGAFLEKNPDIRDRVAALAKTTDDAASLRSDLGVERAMGERKNFVLGGPNSAERMIEHASTVPRVTQAGNLVRNVPVVGKVAGAMLDSRFARRTAEQTGDVMGEVGKIMTRTGRPGFQSTFGEIAALKAKDLQRSELARQIGTWTTSRITAQPPRQGSP